MQAVAVFALFLVFAGVCMAEDSSEEETETPKCVFPAEDQKIGAQCMNDVKGGNIDTSRLMSEPDYFTQADKDEACLCFINAKNLLTEDEELDIAAIVESIHKDITASQKTLEEIEKALHFCDNKYKEKANCPVLTMHCFFKKASAICVDDE